MDITLNNIDEVNAKLQVLIKKEDYEGNVEKELKDIKRKASLKGFRQGKVPMGMINKMYRTSVIARAIDKLVSDGIPKYIEDNKIGMFGQPLPDDDGQEKIDFEKQEEFNFTYNIGLVPDLQFPLSKKNKYSYYEIKIDDSLVKERVEQYQKANGELKEIDKVEEETNFVYGNVVFLDKDSKPIEGKEQIENSLIEPKRLEKESSLLLAKGKGEIIILEPKKIPAQELAYITRMKKEEVEEFEGKIQFAIKKVSKLMPQELGEKLYKHIFPEDEIKTPEEFEEKVKAEIEKDNITAANNKLLFDMRQDFDENLKIQLPEAFIKRSMMLMKKEKDTEEDIDKILPDYLQNLKWELITKKIVEEKQIKIEEAEIRTEAKKEILAYFKNLKNERPITDEELNSYVDMQLQQKQNVERIQNTLLIDKLTKVVLEEANIKNKKVSVEEFKKIIEKDNKGKS